MPKFPKVKINTKYPLIYWSVAKVTLCIAIFYAASELVGYPNTVALIGAIFLYVTFLILAYHTGKRILINIFKNQNQNENENSN